jgi:hypothetical protein
MLRAPTTLFLTYKPLPPFTHSYTSSLNNTVQSVVFTEQYSPIRCFHISQEQSYVHWYEVQQEKQQYFQTFQDGGDTVILPITVADGSEGWLVFYNKNSGLMGSSPFRGTDICLRFFVCVRCPMYVEYL